MRDETAFLKYLRVGGTPPPFKDDLFTRTARAMSDQQASGLDRAVLLRQVLRRLSLRDGRNVPVELAPEFVDSILPVADQAGLVRSSTRMWTARSWEPDWLSCDGGVPDGASLAGTDVGRRFEAVPLQADPFFENSTGFETYRTPGQRAAARAVASTPEGSTVIAMLPTGSGKTEIALCLSDRFKTGLTVIVVPTVALAYDFERRFREHFARRFKGNPRGGNADSLRFAWTASTDAATRDAFKIRIANGQQPILVTSPESMTRALRQTLLETASIGRLKGFVIDEAHLVTQWGRDFRPEFRTLADLRQDFLARSEETGNDRPVTLLLSATLGDFEMSDLIELFGDPGPCAPVVANALRSEPDIWVTYSSEVSQREDRVLDTLAHCPRPAVLYVTKPEKAEEWAEKLRNAGYSRLATVTGQSSAEDRSSVLRGIRADASDARPLDLVVATSAFGLGIDYAHIRSVIHACIPETVDRWYQELGRAGRDGDACAAYFLPAEGDEDEAKGLGLTVLKPDTARQRWENLWGHRRATGGRTFLNLEGARRSVEPGSYNRKWNAQIVQGLVELGALRRRQYDAEDIRELLKQDDVEISDWTAVEKTSAVLDTDDFWHKTWDEWRKREMGRSAESFDRMEKVATGRRGACACIVEAYTPGPELKVAWGKRLEYMEPIGNCGRCPECRTLGLARHIDPPPSPLQEWAVDAQKAVELASFAERARGVNGVVVLTYDTELSRLVSDLATGLATLGVRHFGGVAELAVNASGEAIFRDSRPLAPRDLTPVSTLSYFQVDQRVSRFWLSRRASVRSAHDGSGLVDVLVVPKATKIGGQEVGRDIPALAIATALELVGRE